MYLCQNHASMGAKGIMVHTSLGPRLENICDLEKKRNSGCPPPLENGC